MTSDDKNIAALESSLPADKAAKAHKMLMNEEEVIYSTWGSWSCRRSFAVVTNVRIFGFDAGGAGFGKPFEILLESISDAEALASDLRDSVFYAVWRLIPWRQFLVSVKSTAGKTTFAATSLEEAERAADLLRRLSQ